MSRSAYAYARHLAPILVALSTLSPKPAPWLLAGAALLITFVPPDLRRVAAAYRAKEPMDRGAVHRSLGFITAALVLGGVGFSLKSPASDFATPTAALGVLMLLATLLGLDSPSLVEALAVATPTAEEQALLRPTGFSDSLAGRAERERVARDVEVRGEGALAMYAVMLILESSAALFAGMVFVVIALAGGAGSGWAWQGGGAFVLAFVASGAAVSRIASADEGNPLTPFGGVFLVAFVGVMIAVSNGWKTTLVGAPMVVLAMLLTIIRPVNHRRACDVVFCLGAIATGVGVLLV
ncbi:hypothetical protein [Polyangium mundeleinium]|uniref:Uncharacterized protein n=1 Tax=Polyangium mundeleinium TaxID=2995306 RepID=A0ABT5EMB5_9BACT|nr:hypothetical protein [Polyangium mundeleinium]MDC0742507.1 hypothetical protein [Polyangium mundeleinium]